MASKNIRTTAIQWFKAHFPLEEGPVYASKFYAAAESWSNTKVWFFQIPREEIDPGKNRFIHLLSENHLNGDGFIYLKVPVSFMLLNENSFDLDKTANVFRIYLSAEAASMFKEVRKKGSTVSFFKYVQNYK